MSYHIFEHLQTSVQRQMFTVSRYWVAIQNVASFCSVCMNHGNTLQNDQKKKKKKLFLIFSVLCKGHRKLFLKTPISQNLSPFPIHTVMSYHSNQLQRLNLNTTASELHRGGWRCRKREQKHDSCPFIFLIPSLNLPETVKQIKIFLNLFLYKWSKSVFIRFYQSSELICLTNLK